MTVRKTVILFVLFTFSAVFAGEYFDRISSYVSAEPFFVDFGTHIVDFGSDDGFCCCRYGCGVFFGGR